MSNLIKNQCQNKYLEKWKSSKNIFLKCNKKSCKIYIKQWLLNVLQVVCANGKGIEKTSTMIPKVMPKSIEKQCKIITLQSDSKNIEKLVMGFLLLPT